MSDQAIEDAIQAAGANVAPRITPADLQANIVSEHCFTAANGVSGAYAAGRWNIEQEGQPSTVEVIDVPEALTLLTICVLVLRNGFTVIGESACASPENFNAEIGRKVARDNAIAKVWPLMGYQLKEQLHQTQQSIARVRGEA